MIQSATTRYLQAAQVQLKAIVEGQVNPDVLSGQGERLRGVTNQLVEVEVPGLVPPGPGVADDRDAPPVAADPYRVRQRRCAMPAGKAPPAHSPLPGW